MNKQYKHQGGWVASFLVVGALLTVAVLGGLYYLKVNQKQIATTATSSSKTDSKNANSDDTNSESTTVVPQTDEKKGETVDTNKAATPADTDDEALDSSTALVDSSAKLPTTGPEDTLANAGILAIIAFSFATYVRSRKLA